MLRAFKHDWKLCNRVVHDEILVNQKIETFSDTEKTTLMWKYFSNYFSFPFCANWARGVHVITSKQHTAVTESRVVNRKVTSHVKCFLHVK